MTLEAVGVSSYRELYELGTEEVLERLTQRRVPLHEGDAFLAVLVLRAVGELREATAGLDRTRRAFERIGLALAVVATAATVGQLLQAIL